MRSIPLLQFDAARCPLPDVSVDAVLLLNVLEHIEEDGAALRQVARILKPGGIAVVEVPAGPHLYDVYDEHLLHYRRYSMRTLALQIRAAGLTVLEKSHLGCTVYPAFAFVKRRNRRLASADPDLKRRVVEANIKRTRNSWFLNGLLRWEAWLGRYVSYPFGIRCVAVGKKIRSGRVILR
jgi:SAM-dependent methyltransferase